MELQPGISAHPNLNPRSSLPGDRDSSMHQVCKVSWLTAGDSSHCPSRAAAAQLRAPALLCSAHLPGRTEGSFPQVWTLKTSIKISEQKYHIPSHRAGEEPAEDEPTHPPVLWGWGTASGCLLLMKPQRWPSFGSQQALKSKPALWPSVQERQDTSTAQQSTRFL